MDIFRLFRKQKRNPLTRTHITYSITPQGLFRLEKESNPPLSVEATKMLEFLKREDYNVITYSTDKPEPPQAIKELLSHKLVFKREASSSF